MPLDPANNPLALQDFAASGAGWDAIVQSNTEALAPQNKLFKGNTAIAQANAGTLEALKPLLLPSFTVAGVPSASPAGQVIYVSNESGGAVLAFSDGTNWRRCTDRAIIS